MTFLLKFEVFKVNGNFSFHTTSDVNRNKVLDQTCIRN